MKVETMGKAMKDDAHDEYWPKLVQLWLTCDPHEVEPNQVEGEWTADLTGGLGHLYRRADLPPKVKPLEWKDQDAHGESDDDYPWAISKSIVGVYAVGWNSVFGFWAYADFEDKPLGDDHETLEAAKAAAQADYERRILSALDD